MAPIAIPTSSTNGHAMNGGGAQQRHPTARRSPVTHNGGLAVRLAPDADAEGGGDDEAASGAVRVDESKGEMRAVYEDRGAFVERESLDACDEGRTAMDSCAGAPGGKEELGRSGASLCCVPPPPPSFFFPPFGPWRTRGVPALSCLTRPVWGLGGPPWPCPGDGEPRCGPWRRRWGRSCPCANAYQGGGAQ